VSRDALVLHVEAALLSAGRPVAVDELVAMFEDADDAPDRAAIREAVAEVAEHWRGRSLEVTEVASGFRAQIRKDCSHALSALWQERPVRYSRALLETLALIAYRQPVSRGEIEEVRGVSVSSSIMKTLVEREWVRVVGHREAPGRPALYGTTRNFLDTFNLKNLESLPPLARLKDLDEPLPDLFSEVAVEPDAGAGAEMRETATDEEEAVGAAPVPDPERGIAVESDAGAGTEMRETATDEEEAAGAAPMPALERTVAVEPDAGAGAEMRETAAADEEEAAGAAPVPDPEMRPDSRSGDGGGAG